MRDSRAEQQREEAEAAITRHLIAGGDPEWTAPAILHELIRLGWRPTCQPQQARHALENRP
jgi:hypothetical protein